MNKLAFCKKMWIFLLVITSIFFFPMKVQYAQKRERRKGVLDLKEKKTGSQIVPNIHMQLGCESCHIGRPKQSDKDVKLLMPNNDVVGLCKNCHEDAEHHKVNIIPSDEIKVPDFLPLGKSGESKDKVVCSTCHYTHVELASNSLLRGFSQEAGGKAVFNKRLDLCDACHGKEFTKKSPHVNDEKMCGFCHSSDPKKAKDVIKETIKRDIVELCDFCHGSVQGGHFLKVNPFLDKTIRKEFPAVLPIIDGSVTCVTCHNAHGNTGTLYLLRPEFVDFAVKSKEINPHEKRVFCLSCHDKKSDKGETQASIKFGNDVEMCNWCHASSGQVVHHPVGSFDTVSKITKISDNFNLKENKVGCLTCHDRKFECQIDKISGKIADKNPNYLIGGPYEGKNDMCYKCHIKSEFEKINPHKMVDDRGNIIPGQCKYCHLIPADKIKEGSKDLGLIGKVDFLCVLCHPDRDHPGTRKDGSGARHLLKLQSAKEVVVDGKIKTVQSAILKPINEIPVNLLPLDEKGWLTCATCHQVHSKGVIKGERANTEDMSMWRMPQDQLCSACHPF